MYSSKGRLLGLLSTALRRPREAAASASLLLAMLLPDRAGSERAKRNAEALIAACREYERRHGRLPPTLEELVPGFLTELPPAKYKPPHFGFQYDVTPDPPRHVLGWTEHIPFGRPYYVFEEDRWGYLD
ncbi:hypothetical protein P2318_24325 [Myxococcaceae bacterium GXIMD 01537]